jgi:hypothetical protein
LQVALYTEKLANTVQTDHCDWGFRLSSLYGQDYRYTTSHGILSQQLLVKNAQYGYDLGRGTTDLMVCESLSRKIKGCISMVSLGNNTTIFMRLSCFAPQA